MNPAPMELRRYSLHGLALELRCGVPELSAELARTLGPFEEDDWPDGFAAVQGEIAPYDQDTVIKHLSPTAAALSGNPGCMEIYQENERFWIVDDRWGLTELNLLRGQWRSWLLPYPAIDPPLCIETTVLWPLAQILRGKGLYLMPAVSVVRDGWGVLILCPFSIEPELRALVSAGFKIVGQRWTALREEDGRMAMLHLPGQIERLLTRRRVQGPMPEKWVDLEQEFCGVARNHAFCQTVLIVEPGRRPKAYLKEAAIDSSVVRLRHAWPIYELHPHRRQGQLAMKLARHCRCWDIELSNDPKDLLSLLASLRATALNPTEKKVTVSLSPLLAPARRQAV